jgi:hypothetical protein
MKSASLVLVLLDVLAFACWQRFAHPVLLAAAPQTSAAHPPDTPPGGGPIPGEPVIFHPKPLERPPDFQQASRRTRTPRKDLDPTRAQKDAQELAALAKRIQGEIDQLSRQVLSKDLEEDLKHVQKLAKRLRGEIEP